MTGFDFIVIFMGACLIAFMLIDFMPKRTYVFTNFEEFVLPSGFTLDFVAVKPTLQQDNEPVSGHTLIGFYL